MTKKELLEKLAGVPDGAKVYVEADHAQSPEAVGTVSYTYDDDLPYHGDDIAWKGNVSKKENITAVLIG